MQMEENKRAYTRRSGDRRSVLLGLAVLLGGLCGGVLYGRWPMLQTALSVAERLEQDFWQSFWPPAALLCGVLLAGFCRTGCPLVLAAAVAEGFGLAAFSAPLIRTHGGPGYAQALCLGLLPGVLSLSALFLLGRQAMALSALRLRQSPGKRGKRPPDSAYGLTFLICLALTALSALLRCRVMPQLWSSVETLLLQ